MHQTIRVLLADDHPLILSGIRTLLGTTSDLVVVGEVRNSDEVQHRCKEHQPDVLVMDSRMSGLRAVDTIAALRLEYPQTRIVVLTAHNDEACVRGLVMVGISGYVLKDEAIETLIFAIRSVGQGHTWFSHAVMTRLAMVSHPLEQVEVVSLTDREQQILRLIAIGQNNAHIASALHLAEQTVRNYISRLYVTLGLHSRAEAVVWAREQGMGGK